MYFMLAAMVRSPNTDTVTIFCIIQADIGFHVVPSMQTGVFHRVFIYIYYKMILFTLGKGCVRIQSFCALALLTYVTCTNHCTITLSLITWLFCQLVWLCDVSYLWTPDAGDFVDRTFWWHWARQTFIETVLLLRILAPHNKDSRICAKRPCTCFHHFVSRQRFILFCWCIYFCVFVFWVFFFACPCTFTQSEELTNSALLVL